MGMKKYVMNTDLIVKDTSGGRIMTTGLWGMDYKGLAWILTE